MKNFLLRGLFFIACIKIGFCQSDTVNVYQLSYEKTLTIPTALNSFSSITELNVFVEHNKSIYRQLNMSSQDKQISKSEYDDAVLLFSPTGKDISIVYKNYSKGELYSKHEVAYKYFVVKDSLNIFSWEILNEKKKILGFNCQLASMHFRGRDYQAWFTSELPVGGPWKYDGLPGMILEIKSLDDFIKFKVQKIKNDRLQLDKTDNPFSLRKAISWQEFIDLYKKKAIELLSYRPNENTLGVKSSRGGIETYIKEDDQEYNSALEKVGKY
jgi:GLPGLI family protein